VFAARRLRADGIRVNFTLGFSARENYLIAVAAAPNWANVFMGRCNSFVAEAGLGDGKNVGEKATLSSQRTLRRVRSEHGKDVLQIGASMRGGQQAVDLMGLDVYTMPTSVATEYLELDPDRSEVYDRTDQDPEVKLAGGRSIEAERIDAFWEITPEMDGAMAALLEEDLDAMTGAQLRAFTADHGIGDLFPALDAKERKRLAGDGKIPRYEPWTQRVKAGTASWDGLLTEAALASFATDQAALDQRIREHL
jgi:transaldolase